MDLHLPLAEGTELFCRQGRLQLFTDLQAGSDGLCTACIDLHTGQGWRAAGALQLRVTAPSGACLEVRAAPMQKGRDTLQQVSQPREWTPAAWWRGLRRGRRAA
jgi:hypothetical protein